MKYREGGHRSPILWAVGAYLLVNLIATPLATSSALDNGTVFFANFSVVFAVLGLLLLVGIPHFSAGWARSLRKRKARENPEGSVEIIHLWVSPKRPLAVRVMVVTEGGMAIHASKDCSTVEWSSVERIELVREGILPEDSIRVLMSGDCPPLRFAPLRRTFGLLRFQLSDMEQYLTMLRSTFERSALSRSAQNDIE